MLPGISSMRYHLADFGRRMAEINAIGDVANQPTPTHALTSFPDHHLELSQKLGGPGEITSQPLRALPFHI